MRKPFEPLEPSDECIHDFSLELANAAIKQDRAYSKLIYQNLQEVLREIIEERDALKGKLLERERVIQDQAVAAHRVTIALQILAEMRCYTSGNSVLSEERVKALVEEFEKVR